MLEHPHETGVVSFFTNSKAALQRLKKPRKQTAMVASLHAKLCRIATNGCAVTLQWILLHIGIAGSEAADTLTLQHCFWCLNPGEETSNDRRQPPQRKRTVVRSSTTKLTNDIAARRTLNQSELEAKLDLLSTEFTERTI